MDTENKTESSEEKCEHGWYDGSCCCNCIHQLKLMKHPWNKEFGKGSIMESCGWVCTQTFEDDRFKFLLHEEVGEQMCDSIMRMFAFSNEEIEKVQFLVGNHMRAKCLKEMRTSKKKKLMRHPLFFDLMELHRLDCISSSKPDDSIDFFLEEARNTPPERLRPTPLISGYDLIDMGFKPGPIMGEIIRAIEDAQLEETITTKEEALAFAGAYCVAKQA